MNNRKMHHDRKITATMVAMVLLSPSIVLAQNSVSQNIIFEGEEAANPDCVLIGEPQHGELGQNAKNPNILSSSVGDGGNPGRIGYRVGSDTTGARISLSPPADFSLAPAEAAGLGLKFQPAFRTLEGDRFILVTPFDSGVRTEEVDVHLKVEATEVLPPGAYRAIVTVTCEVP